MALGTMRGGVGISVALAALAALGACTEASERAASGGGGGGDGGVEASVVTDAGAPEAPTACPFDRAGTISGKVTSAPETPSPGVRVCVYQRPELPCVTTADDGTYEHTCLPEGDTGVLFTKEGHSSALWLRVITAGIGQHLDAFVPPDSENTKLFAPVGVTYPRAGHGMVTLNDLNDTGRITITPEGAGTNGPYYSRDGIAIEADAGATVGYGIAFLIAPVGSLKLRMSTPDGATCQQILGGWGSVDNTITVPVLENTETSVFIGCAK